jgi:hypothetical protein
MLRRSLLPRLLLRRGSPKQHERGSKSAHLEEFSSPHRPMFHTHYCRPESCTD